MNVIVIAVFFMVTVFVHEFGHFWAMRRYGIRIKEFGIGFGPAISYRPTNSEGTVYSLGVLPLGGFIKPAEENWFDRLSFWQVFVISISGMAFNVTLASAAMFVMTNFSPGTISKISADGSIFINTAVVSAINMALSLIISLVVWLAGVPIAIYFIFFKGIPVSESVGGPIAIAKMTNDAYNSGIGDLFLMLALLNVGIAATNLIPIHPLDGGQIIMKLLRNSKNKFFRFFIKPFHYVGTTLIIALMIFVIISDFIKYILR